MTPARACGVLLAFDLVRARNQLREIARNPKRVLLWSVFIVWIGFAAFARATRRHPVPDLAEPAATAIAFGVLSVMALTVAAGAQTRRILAFSNPLDAYFLSRSSIPEPIAVAWFQIRMLVLTIGRGAASLVVSILYIAHGALAGAALTVLGLICAWETLRLPAYLITRRSGPWLARALVALGALAAVLAIAAFVPAVPSPLSQTVRAAHAGAVLIALWHGNAIALSCLYGTALCVIDRGIGRGE